LLRSFLSGKRLSVVFVWLRRLHRRCRRSAFRPSRCDVRLIPSVRRVRCAAVVRLARHLTDRTDATQIQRMPNGSKGDRAAPNVAAPRHPPGVHRSLIVVLALWRSRSLPLWSRGTQGRIRIGRVALKHALHDPVCHATSTFLALCATRPVRF
jgi:hypothetical protein